MTRRSTTIPDSYFDVLPRRVSGLVQYVVIGRILRETLGSEAPKKTLLPAWASYIIRVLRKTPEIERPQNAPPGWTHPITIEEFAQFIGVTTRAVDFAIADALKRGLIQSRKQGRSRCYRACTESWAKIAEYKPPMHEGVA